MSSERETRLWSEFQRMLALRRPNSLFRFVCGDLAGKEAEEFLKPWMSRTVITENMDFVPPEVFATRYPGRGPAKYLVNFNCKGLMKTEKGDIVETENHTFEVVFGLDYPSRPPRFVWLTPIWHPNIAVPYLCAEGRPFAIATTLAQIVLMAGKMIQYRIYNLDDPLGPKGKEAADWARQHTGRFPIDRRDLIDGAVHSGPIVAIINSTSLIDWVDPPAGDEDTGGTIVEIF